MTDGWSDRLSDYLDGDLPDNERVALEAHLDGCAECTAVLDDLRRVVQRARTLSPAAPTDFQLSTMMAASSWSMSPLWFKIGIERASPPMFRATPSPPFVQPASCSNASAWRGS